MVCILYSSLFRKAKQRNFGRLLGIFRTTYSDSLGWLLLFFEFGETTSNCCVVWYEFMVLKRWRQNCQESQHGPSSALRINWWQHAGPPLPALERSGPRRTSTASSQSQWALPDPNKRAIAVDLAGLQPARVWALWASPDFNRRESERCGPRRTSTDLNGHKKSHLECQRECQIRMSEDMPDRMSEDMPDRMSEDMTDRMPKDMPDRMSEDVPDIMPDRYARQNVRRNAR